MSQASKFHHQNLYTGDDVICLQDPLNQVRGRLSGQKNKITNR